VFKTAAFSVSCSDVSQNLFYNEDMWPEGCLLCDWYFKGKVRYLLGPIMQITPIMAATKTTQMSLHASSFNMHGFKIGSSWLADLCNMSDIILV